jgi:hypothetical protein
MKLGPQPKHLRRDGTLKEDVLEGQIIDLLEARGYRVMHTSAKRQRGASGVDYGIPDLLVGKPLPAALVSTITRGSALLGLEVKSKDAKGNWKYSCIEQWINHREGLTVVVATPEQALAVVEAFFYGVALSEPPEAVREQWTMQELAAYCDAKRRRGRR